MTLPYFAIEALILGGDPRPHDPTTPVPGQLDIPGCEYVAFTSFTKRGSESFQDQKKIVLLPRYLSQIRKTSCASLVDTAERTILHGATAERGAALCNFVKWQKVHTPTLLACSLLFPAWMRGYICALGV